MLYLRALRDGLAPLPAASPAMRREIDARAAEHGWPAMHAELARVDPLAAARIAPQDAQRIQRALEVFRLTGVPISRWQQRDSAAAMTHFAGCAMRYGRIRAQRCAQRLAARFDADAGGGTAR